jgi:hypothetical protein
MAKTANLKAPKQAYLYYFYDGRRFTLSAVKPLIQAVDMRSYV